MRASEWQPTGPRASRALAALRAAERVSATAVPSPTLARPSRRRNQAPWSAETTAQRGREARSQARAESAVAAEKAAGAEPRAHEATERAAQSIVQARDAPSLQRSNAPTRSNAPMRNAPTRQSRVRTTAPGAGERAEAAEPRADERSRAVDATQKAPDGRPEQLPSRSPAIQAPDQPQESVTAAPQRKRLAMPASAKASLAPTRR